MKYTSVYLASGSPRRKELLTQIGVDFQVLTVDVDETYFADETPQQYVQRVAIEKAQAGWELLNESERLPVVGADTSVIINNQVLGKPSSLDDARNMLQQLSGQTHQVMTAVAVVSDIGTSSLLNTNSVRFAEITDEELNWYLATNEGIDKAGSYAVQGLAARFIEYIEGSYSGIMGLPLRETTILLEQAGYCR